MCPPRTHVPPVREAPEIITTLQGRRVARRLALARDMLTIGVVNGRALTEDDRAFWRSEIAACLCELYPTLLPTETE